MSTQPLHIRRTPAFDAEGERVCDCEGCQSVGAHRAPKSRTNLREYHWFCLTHVREYNKRWDYFKGMSGDDIDRHLRNDMTWHRPTWRFASFDAGDGTRAYAAYADGRIHDPFDMFGGEGPGAGAGSGAAGGKRNRQDPPVSAFAREEKQAFAALNMEPTVDLTRIKTRYKELVKRYHPDANGGDVESEDRLKIINQAYSTLVRRMTSQSA